jgi:hypothetical protein
MDTFKYLGILSNQINTVISNVKGMIQKSTVPVEFEIRIGRFNGHFVPGISKSLFEYAKEKMDTLYGKQEYTSYIVHRYSNGVRESIDNDGHREVIQKRNLLNRDFIMGEYNIRLSAKEEVPYTDSLSSLQLTETVEREGVSYVKDGLVSFDFRKNNNSYEVEIEFDNAVFSMGNAYQYILSQFEEIFKIISDFRIGIPITYEITQMKRNAKTWHEKRPINLKKKHSLNGFYVLPKYDGYRYMLRVFDGICYLIRGNIIIPFQTTTFNGSVILDGEYVPKTQTYYAFDILFSEKLYAKDPFSKRYEELGRIITLLNNPYIRLTPAYHNLLDGLVEISLFKDIDMDGVIFTSNEEYLSENYKYKPSSMMTIDFRVKKMSDGRCGLYSGVDKQEDIFEGRSVECGSLKENAVYEFKWDGTTFIPIRERTDKLYPNSMKVAKDVWEDIEHPYTVSSLLSYLQTISNTDKPLDSIYKMFGETIPSKDVQIVEVTNTGEKEIKDLSEIKWDENGLEYVKSIKVNGVQLLIDQDMKIVSSDIFEEPVPLVDYIQQILGKPLVTSVKKTIEVKNYEMLTSGKVVDHPTIYDENMIRMGVHGDGSCFFHSLLYSIDPKYRTMKLNAQKIYAYKVRNEIASKFTKKMYLNTRISKLHMDIEFNRLMGEMLKMTRLVLPESLSKYANKYGNQFRMFRFIFRKQQKKYNEYVEERKDVQTMMDTKKKMGLNIQLQIDQLNELDTRQVRSVDGITFTHDISFHTVEKWFMPFISDLDDCDELEEEEREHFKKQYLQFLKLVYLTAIDKTHKKYVKDIGNCSTFVDFDMLYLIEDIYNKDVYFIDSTTNEVKKGVEYKGRDSVIMFYFPDLHFEVMGRKDGSNIEYVFKANDPLILSLKNG